MKLLFITIIFVILANDSINCQILKALNLTRTYKGKLPLFIGRGYDIFQGNPKQKEYDKGFRQQIFSFTFNQKVLTTDNIYQIPDGLESNRIAACDYRKTTFEYSSMSSYHKELSAAASVSFDYSSIISGSFTASAEYNSVKSAILENQEIIIESGGVCEFYEIYLPLAVSFNPTLSFRNAINFALKRINNIKWIDIVKKFGTHYTSKIIYGGRTLYQYKLSAQSYSELNQMSVDVKAAASLSYMEYSGELNTDVKNSYKKIYAFNKRKTDFNQINIGGKPNNNFAKWVESVADNLMPIKYDLEPISNLFTSFYFKYTPADLNKIKSFYDNAIKEYCKSAKCETPSDDTVKIPTLSAQFIEDKITFGSNDGEQFVDDPDLNLGAMIKIKEITIRSGLYIDQIQITISNDVQNKLYPKHGGTGGGEETFNIPEDEYITQVEVRSDRYVNSLTFITNKNTKSRKFGGDGGKYRLLSAPPNGQLIGIKGRSSSVLSSIGFIWMIRNYKQTPSISTKYVEDISSSISTNWGSWGEFEYCKNSFGIGFITKVESNKGSNDDTAMNGLYLYCSDYNQISSTIGEWGEWGTDIKYCKPGNKIKGFKIKSEKIQNSGDDTATNAIRFKCEDDNEIISLEGEWGDWSDWIDCPSNSYICGIRTQVEGNQGGGDDTSLNNVQFKCCSYS